MSFLREQGKQAANAVATLLGQVSVTDVTTKELVSTTQTGWDKLQTSPLESGWFKETTPDLTIFNMDVPFLLFPYKLLMGVEKSDVFGGTSFVTSDSFVLPISPQQLNISTPFAITVTPTLNGIVEEHNSTRFRDIEIAGTMGVNPSRGDMDQLQLEGLLGGLLRFTGIQDQIDNFQTSVSNIIPFDRFLSGAILERGLDSLEKTGYRNLHRLRNFLEVYAEKKKADPALRLVFANYKDNQLYYVTPVNFVVRRSAENPLEYQYQLALKSWGRFDPNAFVFTVGTPHIPRVNILSTILAATTALSNSIKALGSVLPYANSIVLGTAGTALSSIAGLGSALRTNAQLFNTTNGTLNLFSGYQSIGAGLTGLSNMQLTTAGRIQGTEQTIPQKEPTSKQLNETANAVKNTSLFIADTLGLGNIAYDLVNERTPAPAKVAQPTPEQIDAIFQLNTITNSLNSLSTDEMMKEPENASPMEYVAGLASKSGIAFQVPVSKFPVPFPYGPTLEHLAAQYLGDQNRWIEIAALNGLQEPYIDHVGYDVKFLTNGYKNKVTVASRSVVKLQPVVLFSDSQARKTFTVIDVQEISPSVFEITLDNDVNKLDLSAYKVNERAYIHAYAPNTVHAGQTIYIPSQESVSNINDFNSSTIPSLKQYDELIRVSGVDLLLTSNDKEVLKTSTQRVSYGKASSMDLLLDPTSGDVMLAGPEAMLLQSLKIAIFTPLGSLLRHPTFGVGMPVGQSVADINLGTFREVIKKAILQDSSFSDVEFTEFSLKSGALRIHLGVRVAQLNKLLPVSFDVNLNAS